MRASSLNASERPALAPAPGSEIVAAGAVAATLLAIGALVWRFGSAFAGENDAVFPAAYSGSFVAMIVSATIARNQFKATGFPALAYLSNVFGISAVLIVPFAAVMPHVFSPTGFGLGNQIAMWLWSVRMAFFALLVMAYAVAEWYFSKHVASASEAYAVGSRYAWAAAFVACAAVAAVFFLHAKLPSLGDGGSFTPPFHRFVEPALLGLDALALAVLAAATRFRHTTSVWLAIVLVAFATQTLLGAERIHGQYTVVWYAVFGAGAVVQALFLAVQLRSAHEELSAFAEDKKSLIEETLRDPLTGLLNRRGFDERFEDILTLSRLSKKSASLVLFDIDHFKAFNDAFGHPAGDDALRKIGAEIATLVNRPTDACCRVGGEEFAIVLGETDASGAMAVAERVRAAVMRLRIPQDPDFAKGLTVSVGTATAMPSVVLSPEELYERGDKALYKAKRLGRNRIAAYGAVHASDLQTV
jgi:diguanylate cyclase (GGDEF)-like protein